MKSFSQLLCTFLLIFSVSVQANSTLTFPSKDGLQITVDTYINRVDDRPLVVLFHQAGWSRGEYIEIAPKLNALGFNVMAVDLRSGNRVNGVINETAKRAKKAQKGSSYLDAVQDIEAALDYARGLVGSETKVIAWGSSYSAALVLQIIGEKPDLADAVVSFSPGEYFKRAGKPAHWVRDSAKNISVPVFMTSARSEKRQWQAIFDGIKSKGKYAFIPATKGHHGSRALWGKYADSEAYWTALTPFLKALIPQ